MACRTTKSGKKVGRPKGKKNKSGWSIAKPKKKRASSGFSVVHAKAKHSGFSVAHPEHHCVVKPGRPKGAKDRRQRKQRSK